MGLVRYLPTPSDRMAIIWTLLNIEDSIILEYGTAGTTMYSYSSLRALGLELEGKLFTTQMSESDVIMGNMERLENALLEIDEEYSPKVIFVLASAVSSVIGADVKGVCNYMQEKVSAKILTFSQAGFSGDYSTGLQAVYTSLIKEIAQNTGEKDEKSYNILGSSIASCHNKADIAEIKRMMSEYFSMQAHTVLSLSTSIDKIANMSKARLNLVLTYEALEGARLLKERFGTPFIYALPYGYTATYNWLEKIAQILDKPLSFDEKKRVEESSYKGKALVYADYDKALALGKFMQELGFEVSHILCTHSLHKIENCAENIVYLKEEKAKLDIFKSLSNTLILADNVLAKQADKTNTYICVSSPYLGLASSLEEQTLMGINGADFIKKELTRAFL